MPVAGLESWKSYAFFINKQNMQKRIIDNRKKEKFMIDDEYLNGQAKLCGWQGTIVYISLCRHSNKNQECFPSIKLMAEENGVGRNTIIKGLKNLENRRVISITKKRRKDGKWLNNVYILTDKSTWDYNQVLEKDTGKIINQVPLRTKPSPSQNKTKSSTGTLRKHIEGNTYKETHISKTKFCGKDINFLIGLFEPVNIMFNSFFKNKTERKAIEEILLAISKKYDNPVEKLELTINALQITNKQKFCPKVTKPTELRRDISKIIAFASANPKLFKKKESRKA